MIKKLAIGAGVVALTAGFAVAPASAAPMTPKNEGAACVQAGIGFLKENGLFGAAAKKQIDYGALAAAGVIDIPGGLPLGTKLSLGTVVKLHTTNPEYFPVWCASK